MHNNTPREQERELRTVYYFAYMIKGLKLKREKKKDKTERPNMKYNVKENF